MLNNTLIKAVTETQEEGGIQLYINLQQHNLQVNGRKLDCISMWVAAAADEWDADMY